MKLPRRWTYMAEGTAPVNPGAAEDLADFIEKTAASCAAAAFIPTT